MRREPQSTQVQDARPPAPGLERRLGWADRVVLVACLIAIGALLTVLSRYPRASGAAGLSTDVGVARLTLLEVRRRFADSLVWETLETNQRVYGGDAIFVSPSSVAVLEFDDGARLDLDEGTLVTIAPGTAAAHVDLAKGGLVAQTGGSGLRVESQTGAADFQPGSAASVRVHAGDGTRIQVSSGVAVISGANDAQTLSANQASTIAPDGAVRPVTTWTVVLQAPKPSETIFFHTRIAPVQLQYIAQSADRLFLQVASDPTFAALETSMRVKAGTGLWQPDAAGIYWWRLINEWGEAQSETRKLVVAQDVAPETIGPAHHALLTGLDGRDLVFEWTAAPGVTTYQMELANNVAFERPVLQLAVGGERYAMERPLPEGTYYWRVRGQRPGQPESPYSRVAEFRYTVAPVMEAPERMESRPLKGPGGEHGP